LPGVITTTHMARHEPGIFVVMAVVCWGISLGLILNALAFYAVERELARFIWLWLWAWDFWAMAGACLTLQEEYGCTY